MENTGYQESRMPLNHERINSSCQSKCLVLREILGVNYSVFVRWMYRSLSDVVHDIYLFYIASWLCFKLWNKIFFKKMLEHSRRVFLA